MTAQEGNGEATRSRQTVSALLILVVVSGVVMSLSFHPHYDRYPDAAMYIICSQSLLAGEGYTYLGEPFVMRPPGFSVMLAPVLAVFGTDFRVLNLFAGLTGLVTLLLLFLYARPHLGPWVAVALALAVGFNHEYLHRQWQVMSDLPGLGLALLALLLERSARRSPSWRRDLTLAVVVVAATFVRSINLFLVPAIVLARWIRPPERPAPRLLRWGLCFAAVALLLLAPWVVRDARSRDRGIALQTLNHSYWVANWHQDCYDPASPLLPPAKLAERARQRTVELWHLLGSRLSTKTPDLGSGLLGGLLLAGLLAGLVVRRRPAELYAVASLGVLALYFLLVPRLVLPIYVIALSATAEMLLWAAQRLIGGRAGQVLVAVLLIAVAAVGFHPRRRLEAIEKQAQTWARRCEHIRSTVPSGVPIAAREGWDFGVLLGRPCPSLLFILRRQGWEGLIRYLDENEIGGVIWDRNPRQLTILKRRLRRRGYQVRMVQGPVRILLIDRCPSVPP